jgi:DNA-binding FadR family transcriptional regulator
MIQRTSPREDDLIDLPMSRRDIADYLGLTLETVSRVLWDLERRGAIEISDRRSIMLRNHSANGRGETAAELFEGVNGHRPKTEKELQEWLVSPEGKAATLFTLSTRKNFAKLRPHFRTLEGSRKTKETLGIRVPLPATGGSGTGDHNAKTFVDAVCCGHWSNSKPSRFSG